MRRVVEPAEVLDELGDDVGLPEHRHEDRIDREVGVVEPRDLGVGDALHHVEARALQRHQELERRRREEREAHHGERADGGLPRPHHGQPDDEDRGHQGARLLAAGEDEATGQLGVAAEEPVGGVVRDGLAEQVEDRVLELPRIDIREGERAAEVRGQVVGERRLAVASVRGDELPAVIEAADGQPSLGEVALAGTAPHGFRVDVVLPRRLRDRHLRPTRRRGRWTPSSRGPRAGCTRRPTRWRSGRRRRS